MQLFVEHSPSPHLLTSSRGRRDRDPILCVGRFVFKAHCTAVSTVTSPLPRYLYVRAFSTPFVSTSFVPVWSCLARLWRFLLLSHGVCDVLCLTQPQTAAIITALVLWVVACTYVRALPEYAYAANVASAENDEVREMSSPVTCCDAACPLFGLLFHDSSANCCR